MNKQNLLAILVGFVFSFLLGWLTYGVLLKDFMASATMPGVSKPEEEMDMLWIVIGNLCWVVLLTLVLGKMGANNMMAGATNALWISALIALNYDSFFWATTNIYTGMNVIWMDVLVCAVTGAITGGVIGWMLGMNNKPASTS